MMHLVATNACMAIRALVKESYFVNCSKKLDRLTTKTFFNYIQNVLDFRYNFNEIYCMKNQVKESYKEILHTMESDHSENVTSNYTKEENGGNPC